MLVDHPHADVERVAMAGLSGGGWQTILLSSLDRRVTLANPVAGYSSFKTRVEYFSDLGDSEQTPTDLAMTCRLCAPDRLAGTAADAADLQRQGRMLLCVGPRAAAAAGCGAADLQVGRRWSRGCARTSTKIPALTTSSARIARRSTK